MKYGEVKGTQLFKQRQECKKTYKELFEELVLSAKIKGRSKYTLKSYHYHNKYFMQFIGENTLCNIINQQTLENYILYMRDGKGLTNGVTINSYLHNISPILKFGSKRAYLSDFQNITSHCKFTVS
ncbi:phage integrase SAM-like domain-containing protein [Clostridium sp. FP2]|uniref:phage integrase SAM-like domain-containing protein n=1 Tax=Clostridium TaxID=1485 RepID=UPI0013E96A7C|nr:MULTISPECIES: phage integrase SAM-like domain-containing protein [Clostridium]MBW9155463.1 phage integrase SAM-like domain-containing protein [Clostridium tagluense]MBZ9621773.1 phage integrase SAM-like domain-containing protein [Clostridium sp. FP2]WLC66094.1 phage integrase SAM-like domain-containing protein [Clostridium tagluense]